MLITYCNLTLYQVRHLLQSDPVHHLLQSDIEKQRLNLTCPTAARGGGLLFYELFTGGVRITQKKTIPEIRLLKQSDQHCLCGSPRYNLKHICESVLTYIYIYNIYMYILRKQNV